MILVASQKHQSPMRPYQVSLVVLQALHCYYYFSNEEVLFPVESSLGSSVSLCRCNKTRNELFQSEVKKYMFNFSQDLAHSFESLKSTLSIGLTTPTLQRHSPPPPEK
jgi:hypothetical protein